MIDWLTFIPWGVRIPLGRDGTQGYALIDATDLPIVEGVTWQLRQSRNRGPHYRYADRKVDGRTVLMHRLIMGLEIGDPQCVDHINGNGLDNRRTNLRLATPQQNAQNRRHGIRGRSKFRGVSWNSAQQRWLARASVNGRRHFLGAFVEAIDAARAAEAYRREHMPFAEPDPHLVEAEMDIERRRMT